MVCAGGGAMPTPSSHCGSWLPRPLASTIKSALTVSPLFSLTPAMSMLGPDMQ